jgi:hypothetical protein
LIRFVNYLSRCPLSLTGKKRPVVLSSGPTITRATLIRLKNGMSSLMDVGELLDLLPSRLKKGVSNPTLARLRSLRQTLKRIVRSGEKKSLATTTSLKSSWTISQARSRKCPFLTTPLPQKPISFKRLSSLAAKTNF